MAYGIVHYFPGGTKEQYEASLAEVHPSRDSLPWTTSLSPTFPLGDCLDVFVRRKDAERDGCRKLSVSPSGEKLVGSRPSHDSPDFNTLAGRTNARAIARSARLRASRSEPCPARRLSWNSKY